MLIEALSAKNHSLLAAASLAIKNKAPNHRDSDLFHSLLEESDAE